MCLFHDATTAPANTAKGIEKKHGVRRVHACVLSLSTKAHRQRPEARQLGVIDAESAGDGPWLYDSAARACRLPRRAKTTTPLPREGWRLLQLQRAFSFTISHIYIVGRRQRMTATTRELANCATLFPCNWESSGQNPGRTGIDWMEQLLSQTPTGGGSSPSGKQQWSDISYGWLRTQRVLRKEPKGGHTRQAGC